MLAFLGWDGTGYLPQKVESLSSFAKTLLGLYPPPGTSPNLLSR
jgi:hypothetical protein